MSDRTSHLPVSVQTDGSRMDAQMKCFAPQMNSAEPKRPTGRLARAGSEVAA